MICSRIPCCRTPYPATVSLAGYSFANGARKTNATCHGTTAHAQSSTTMNRGYIMHLWCMTVVACFSLALIIISHSGCKTKIWLPDSGMVFVKYMWLLPFCIFILHLLLFYRCIFFSWHKHIMDFSLFCKMSCKMFFISARVTFGISYPLFPRNPHFPHSYPQIMTNLSYPKFAVQNCKKCMS